MKTDMRKYLTEFKGLMETMSKAKTRNEIKAALEEAENLIKTTKSTITNT